MAVSPEYKAFILEMLEPLGDVSVRPMFGVGGMFCHGVMFGLIGGDRVFFKVDDELRPEFEAEGLKPYVFESSAGKQDVMSYLEAPDYTYDDQEEMLVWARKALEAAFREDARKPPGKRKRT